MRRLAATLAAALSLVACTDGPSDIELAADTDLDAVGGKADRAWDAAPTLHVGERLSGHASAGGRRVYPLWIAGTSAAPVSIDIVASAQNEGDVRVAVLGPVKNGGRPVVAAAGYAAPRESIDLRLSATARGEYLVVVGSFELATDTSFSLGTHCATCASDQIDVLAEPKAGALVATENGGIVQVELGAVLADRNFDVEVELWASPPAQDWNASKVATSVASGTQVNIRVPDSVLPGDDLRLVVRRAGGAILDAGVTTRYAPVLEPIVRMDALLYGDLVSVGASGIVGYYEGVASLSMRSESRNVILADHDLPVDRPGQPRNGFGAFDATFNPPLEIEPGVTNPNLPTNGELLSIGYLNGTGDYQRLGCFEYCNDLSGEEACTGGARSCPASTW
ncbi:MAG: hypothetical protein ACKV2T_26160 [Kofleriaceae bacterium]